MVRPSYALCLLGDERFVKDSVHASLQIGIAEFGEDEATIESTFCFRREIPLSCFQGKKESNKLSSILKYDILTWLDDKHYSRQSVYYVGNFTVLIIKKPDYTR